MTLNKRHVVVQHLRRRLFIIGARILQKMCRKVKREFFEMKCRFLYAGEAGFEPAIPPTVIYSSCYRFVAYYSPKLERYERIELYVLRTGVEAQRLYQLAHIPLKMLILCQLLCLKGFQSICLNLLLAVQLSKLYQFDPLPVRFLFCAYRC